MQECQAVKKIEAVVDPFKLDEIKELLAKLKIPQVTVYEVKGAGAQQGKPKAYRGANYIQDCAEVKIEMVVDDDEAEHIAELIIDTLRTGLLHDGEVVIIPVEQCLRIRAGQRGCPVSDWTRNNALQSRARDSVGLKSYLSAIKRKLY